MRLIPQLTTLSLFIQYLLRAVDEHSLHSPFAYHVYKHLKRKNIHLFQDHELERARMEFKESTEHVPGIDFGAGSRKGLFGRSRDVASIARHGISSTQDCTFIRALLKLREDSLLGIELGTSLGLTTAYIARAQNVGQLYSIEGNDLLYAKAGQLMERFGCRNVQLIHGKIDEELPWLLRKLKVIDFALIDANHTSTALLRYFEWLAPKLHPDGWMLIDDIRWSADMYSGWKRLIEKPEVRLSLEFMQKGVLFFREGVAKQHYVVTE